MPQSKDHLKNVHTAVPLLNLTLKRMLITHDPPTDPASRNANPVCMTATYKAGFVVLVQNSRVLYMRRSVFGTLRERFAILITHFAHNSLCNITYRRRAFPSRPGRTASGFPIRPHGCIACSSVTCHIWSVYAASNVNSGTCTNHISRKKEVNRQA